MRSRHRLSQRWLLSSRAALTFATIVLASADSATASPPNDALTILERGPSYRVIRASIPVLNQDTGVVETKLSEYTELADGLHYWDGEWKESQDLIELTANGAAALKGQTKVRFGANLAGPGVVDLTSVDGKNFRINVLGLFYFDAASGKSVQIAAVKDAGGTLFPPNSVVYNDAFDGVLADVQYVYPKNGFEQNVVLLQKPPPPESFGLNPQSTRLEAWTRFVTAARPVVTTSVLTGETDPAKRASMVEPDLTDDYIDFGALFFPLGRAFLASATVPAGAPAQIERVIPDPGELLVGKHWENAGKFSVLIESLNWADLKPSLGGLEQAALQPKARVFPKRSPELIAALHKSNTSGEVGEIRLASTRYDRRGVVIDYITLSGSTTAYTFLSSHTYLISGTFTITQTATFYANSVMKYENNSSIWLNQASFTFPAAGVAPIFTSKDDNLFGDLIANSTGNPTYMANGALSVYYVGYGYTVQNCRFRWCKRALSYGDSSSANYPVQNTAFDNSQTGIYMYLPSGHILLSNVRQCNVITPVQVGAGYPPGSLTPDCGDKRFPLPNLQHESSVTINPANPLQVAVVAANEPHNVGFLKVTSSDGGSTWSTPALTATGSSGDGLPAANADVQAAYDATGNLFACYTTVNNTAIVLLKIRNGEATWTQVTQFGSSWADRPVLATGPGGTYGYQSVWVLYIDGAAGGHLTLAGAPVASDGTVGTFSSYTPGCSTAPPGVNPPSPGGLAVGPTGKVLMAYESRSDASRLMCINFDTDGLGPSQATSGCTAQIGVNMAWLHRIDAQPNRWIGRVPVLAWDRNASSSHYNRKYVAFTDTPPTDPEGQDTDVYVMSSNDDAGSVWSQRLRVNDASVKSQFFPGMAVDQTSGRVAVSWYDCRNDAGNQLTQFFGAVSTDGFATQPRNFQLSPAASYSNQANCDSTLVNYGDYTGLAFHAGHLFPTWCSYAGTSDYCGDVHTCTMLAW